MSPLLKPTYRLLVPKLIHLITGLTTTSPESNVRHSKSLHSRKEIIIKPADKGSGVVVMDRQQYIDEAMRQLKPYQL